MAYSVNWITKVITVPTADLTLVSGTRYQLNLENFLNEVRRLEWEFTEGLWAPQILEHTNVRVDFAGANYAAFDEIVNGYTVTITGVATRVDLVGSNNNIIDVINNTNILIPSFNSAGLTNINEIRSISFMGKEGKGVTIAPSTGNDSSVYDTGSRENPCKTEANLEIIAGDKYRNVYVKEDINLTLDHSHGHTFFGDNPQTITIDVGDVATYPAKDVTGCKFQDAKVTGEMDSANELRECIVAPITNANGFIYKSTIIGPIVALAGTSLSLEGCWTATPGTDNIIDFDNVASTIAITDWSGGTIQVINMVPGCVFGMGGTAGSFKLAASCTGGSVNYGGAIRLKEDLSTGVATNDANTATQVLERIVDGTISVEMVLKSLLAANAGKRVGLGTATEQYMRQDGVTAQVTFPPDDAEGNGTPVINTT